MSALPSRWKMRGVSVAGVWKDGGTRASKLPAADGPQQRGPVPGGGGARPRLRPGAPARGSRGSAVHHERRTRPVPDGIGMDAGPGARLRSMDREKAEPALEVEHLARSNTLLDQTPARAVVARAEALLGQDVHPG